MATIRVVIFDGRTGSEVTAATVESSGEGIVFAQAGRHLQPWLVLETDPPVWLSTRPAGDLDDAGTNSARTVARVVRRLTLLARHLLAVQGSDAHRIDELLPLLPDGASRQRNVGPPGGRRSVL